MRGRMRRYGVIFEQKYIDPSGFPITLNEMLLNLNTCTFAIKSEAVKAARTINASIPDIARRKAYAATIWIDVAGHKAGRS